MHSIALATVQLSDAHYDERQPQSVFLQSQSPPSQNSIEVSVTITNQDDIRGKINQWDATEKIRLQSNHHTQQQVMILLHRDSSLSAPHVFESLAITAQPAVSNSSSLKATAVKRNQSMHLIGPSHVPSHTSTEADIQGASRATRISRPCRGCSTARHSNSQRYLYCVFPLLTFYVAETRVRSRWTSLRCRPKRRATVSQTGRTASTP